MGRAVEVKGGKRWRQSLSAIYGRVERATYPATTEAARVVERTGKRVLRTYTHPEGTPTTSPAGQPPAMVTGNLIRSWHSTSARGGRKPGTVVARTGPTAEYARIQDLGGEVENAFGTGTTVRLPARPYVGPAAKASIPAVRRVYKRRWTQALLS